VDEDERHEGAQIDPEPHPPCADIDACSTDVGATRYLYARACIIEIARIASGRSRMQVLPSGENTWAP